VAAAFTVRVTVVVCVKPLDVPVIVTVDVPVAAVLLAVSVSVLVEVAGLGLNAAVTPLGTPVVDKVTLPEKPFDGNCAGPCTASLNNRHGAWRSRQAEVRLGNSIHREADRRRVCQTRRRAGNRDRVSSGGRRC
jgi:hypothetical protein